MTAIEYGADYQEKTTAKYQKKKDYSTALLCIILTTVIHLYPSLDS